MTRLKGLPRTEKSGAAGRKIRAGKLLLLAACGLAAQLASAEEIFRDPTRPPSSLYAPTLNATEEWVETQAGSILQSIRKSNGRYTAVINGETVIVGSKIGDARVVKIRETEVILKTADSLQTLKLFPDVEKRPTAIEKRIRR